MNFIEAVQALKDGRGEGIRRTSWSHSDHVVIVRNELKFKTTANRMFAGCIDGLLQNDWQLVNPKPVMETVEVKRWAKVSNKTGSIICFGEEDNKPQTADFGNYTIFKLTGTYQRPVKEKVKRREEIKLSDSAEWHIKDADAGFGRHGKFFYEWEE
jgi:hypothetical protein